MHFVGLDLAWGERRPSGIAVVDTHGKLVDVGVGTDDVSIVAALRPYTRDECLVAIDAPLIVKNATGQRPAERELNADFGRFEAGAHPANTSNRLFDPPRGAVLASALDLDMDPRSTASRRAIEVYPHPATVSLFGLGRTLKYKRRNHDAGQRKSDLCRLLMHIESLEDRDPPLRLRGCRNWIRLRARIHAASRPFELNACEDPLDAVICAYVGFYSHHRPHDVTVYGDFATGYVVTPTLPPDVKATPRRHVAAEDAATLSQVQHELTEIRTRLRRT